MVDLSIATLNYQRVPIINLMSSVGVVAETTDRWGKGRRQLRVSLLRQDFQFSHLPSDWKNQAWQNGYQGLTGMTITVYMHRK